MAILFETAQRSDKTNFGNNKPPSQISEELRVLSCIPGVYKVLMDEMIIKNLEGTQMTRISNF